MSNWSEASPDGAARAAALAAAERTRLRRQAALACPKCGTENRPGVAVMVELDEQGRALCAVCAHTWIPEKGAE